MLLNGKKGISIFIFIIATVGIMVLIYYKSPIYGNNEESIKKILYNTDSLIRDGEEINIVDIIDLGGSRFVGFCTQYGRTGLMEFKVNKKGNYVYRGTELEDSEVGKFIAWTNDDIIGNGYTESSSNESYKTLYIIVANKTEGYNVKLVVNDEYDFQGNIPNCETTMLVFEMPKTSTEEYEYKLEIIDSSGNKLE